MSGKGRGRLLSALVVNSGETFPKSIPRDPITEDRDGIGHRHDDAIEEHHHQSSSNHIKASPSSSSVNHNGIGVSNNNNNNNKKSCNEISSKPAATVSRPQLTSYNFAPLKLKPLFDDGKTEKNDKSKILGQGGDSGQKQSCGPPVNGVAPVKTNLNRSSSEKSLTDFSFHQHDLAQRAKANRESHSRADPNYTGVVTRAESRPPKPVYTRPPSPVQVAQLSRIEGSSNESNGIRLLIGKNLEAENNFKKQQELARRMLPPNFGKGINFEQLSALSAVVHSKQPDKVEPPFKSITRLYSCSSSSSELIHKFIQNLSTCKITDLTEVQKHVLPNMLTGSLDLVVNAPNGTGKTISYIIALIKIIAYFRQTRKDKEEPHWPMALIVIPNKELAYRIFTDLYALSQGINVWIYYFYGGLQEALAEDKKLLEKKPQIVICTPNRLVHFLDEQILDLGKIGYVIIDNFDILLPNLRFQGGPKENLERAKTETRLMELFEECRKKPIHPRFFVFSSKIHGQLKSLAERVVAPSYAMMVIGHPAGGDTQQSFIQVHHSQKKKELLKMLQSLYRRYNRLIIFAGTSEMTEKVVAFLNMNAFFSGAYHTNLDQSSRDQLMKSVKSNTIRILVTTFAMARSIHLQGYCCVVNYDVPRKREEYLACIGRTSKIGTVAEAITFFNPTARQDREMAPELIAILNQLQQCVPEFLLDYNNNNNSDSKQD